MDGRGNFKPLGAETEEKASKDHLVVQRQYDEADDDDDLELNEISTQSSILSKKGARRLRCTTQEGWTDSLSPANPLFWLAVFLFVVAVFGWLGLFICLDGGCSRTAYFRKGLPGWNVIPDCRQRMALRDS